MLPLWGHHEGAGTCSELNSVWEFSSSLAGKAFEEAPLARRVAAPAEAGEMVQRLFYEAIWDGCVMKECGKGLQTVFISTSPIASACL
jgi:hypothetical protein